MPSQNANALTTVISSAYRTSDKGRRVVGHYFKPFREMKEYRCQTNSLNYIRRVHAKSERSR